MKINNITILINICSNFKPELLANHMRAIGELISRDRNHASVVMWSIANEPKSNQPEADQYFKEIVHFTKSLDSKRPITAALNAYPTTCRAAQYLDIISFNRYNGWYNSAGKFDVVVGAVVKEATAWHNAHNKPVIIMEYGAGTIPGLGVLPVSIWSEGYQMEIFSLHFQAFDRLRSQNFFIGEFIWNFADFKTDQSYTRVVNNRKGIFTRDRHPKASAALIRRRYFALARKEEPHCRMPSDLDYYVSDGN